MNKLLAALASLKLAVALLIVLLVALAAGTIIESTSNAEVARRSVYYSWWFLGLQGLFAASVIASLVTFFPWGRRRLGFLLLHGSMIVILGGAAVTYFLKTEGQLGLWEGQASNQLANVDSFTRDEVVLPFSVRLDDFRIDTYQGTMRPANFTSEITVIEADGTSFQTAIWMNNPFTHHGWTFFQSSYRQQDGREATILSVSRDPGQNIVFVGYTLLVLGMCVVLGTRISQKRAAARAEESAAAGDASSAKKTAGVAVAALLAALPAARADDGVAAAGLLPVQHDGRVMALDTLARETVWKVTGSRSWSGEPQLATFTRWLADPPRAANAPVVKIGSSQLATAAGLPGASHASFSQLVGSRAVLELMDGARRAAAQDLPRTGVLADAEKLEERLIWMQRVLRRDLVRAVPVAPAPGAKWSVAPLFDAAGLAAMAAGPRPQGWPAASEIEREVTYNQVRPVRVAWIVLAIALLASLVGWSRRSKLLDAVAIVGLVGGFGVMTWGILTRWAIGDRIPAANMYESLLFLAWGVGAFAVIALVFMRNNRLLVMNANAGAALTMALTDLLPMDGFIHPVPPVLSGTPWLAIHVPIIMIGYAVLALGLVIAHVQIGYQALAPKRTDLARKASDLLYWYIHVGNILLVVGILTGSVWAASSWGRYWGWDPKEVWSLVAFLAYMAILHARWDRLFGSFGVAALSIVAFQTILMTYLGVNYVLGTGLHSYGFGDSPIVTWMIVIAAAETAFLLLAWAAYRRQGPARTLVAPA